MTGPVTLADLAATVRDDDALLAARLAGGPLSGGAALPVADAIAARVPGPAGPRYGLIAEAILEGYRCHYGAPRLYDAARLDDALRVLAGDHLYARGLVLLAAEGDLDGVRDLAALIARAAALRADDDAAAADALWAPALGRIAARAAGQAADGAAPLALPDDLDLAGPAPAWTEWTVAWAAT